ncbi:glycosyltransferase [Paracoccus sediminicola]|uniref:glycosyltransferase n=1 Tax=Paracoccus sediminicola TaxID=3017783 RepID=UPI0022EFDA8A|nr:glycosyltransferase [Paracoccus sediminicola]WBU58186.1 glycosyltransferase [Paracoccus sediminicola]
MAETLAKTAPSRTPRHVVHVTEAPLGGVVTYLEELLSAQIAGMPDTQIELLTPEVNREALAGLEGPNFKMIAFPHRRGSKADLMRLGWRVIRHLRRTRPEILHIHSSFAGAAIRALAPLIPRGTKVIYCPHGWAFSRRGSKRMQEGVARVERALSRVTDRIICISDYERQEALHAGIAPEKLSVIDNGVSQRSGIPAPEPKAEDAPRLIAFAGRFDEQKGYDTFLEVMRLLGDEARAIAIGSAIVSADELPELPDNVQLLGWQPRDKVYALYAEADLLLVPSRWEGFGLVAVEAMQARLAVFASRVGGLQDIVVDGETGRLFTPDDADQITAMIRETSDAQLRDYGEAGYRRYLSRYTAARMAREVGALYAALLDEGAGRS